ncbi:MAG: urease accessory protein UreE [Flavisolibacter sp.]
MLINQKLGNLKEFDIEGCFIDRLPIEWFETSKRILHKKTVSGIELSLKFLKENPNLSQDDVIYKDASRIVVIDIKTCEVIEVEPQSMYEMALLCYEIGNKHLPLFYEEGILMMPFEEPLYRWLLASGFNPRKQTRKLLQQLKTSVTAHGHSGSLFSKILQLTNAANV